MKKLPIGNSYIVLAGIFLFASFHLKSQSYWMEKAGSPTADEGYSISLDGSNNTYTTGYFTGTATFGSTVLTATGVSDIFIAKTNSNGVYQWAVKAGDGGSDRGLAIKTDSRGNSYVTGYYYGTAHFGSQTINSTGLQDVFVAKYDVNGNLKWVVSAGGTESDIGNGITVDNPRIHTPGRLQSAALHPHQIFQQAHIRSRFRMLTAAQKLLQPY